MTTKFRTVQSKFNSAAIAAINTSTKRRNSMQTGVIIRRNANTFIPNDYLEKALAANPHGWGAAIVTEEGLQVNRGGEITIEEVQEAMKAFADKDITFYFCNSEAGLNEEDIGPYVVLEKDKDTPLLLAFVDGNFPSFAKADSSHPAEFHFVEDYLGPKFEAMAEMTDDLSKMMEMVKKPYFKKELLLNSVSRGTVTLVAVDGTSLTFAQGDLSAEYPWGWVSNNYGYAMGPPKEVVVEKPKGMFSKRSTVREKAGSPPPDKIAEAVKVPETSAAIITNYTTKVLKMPSHFSRSERKDWLKRHIGYAPKTLAERGGEIHVAVDPKGKLMTFSEVKSLGAGALAVIQLLVAKNPPREKNAETDHIPESNVELPADKKPDVKAVSSEILPLMSPTTRDHIKKLIAGNADQIMDPVKMKALTEKYTDFAAQVGAKSIKDFKYSFEMLFQLARDKPDGIAVLCWNALNIIHSKDEKEVVEQKIEDAPKKSMFSRRAG